MNVLLLKHYTVLLYHAMYCNLSKHACRLNNTTFVPWRVASVRRTSGSVITFTPPSATVFSSLIWARPCETTQCHQDVQCLSSGIFTYKTGWFLGYMLVKDPYMEHIWVNNMTSFSMFLGSRQLEHLGLCLLRDGSQNPWEIHGIQSPSNDDQITSQNHHHIPFKPHDNASILTVLTNHHS